MTYLEIVNAVLSDRFAEAQRADAKTWVNHRYWWLWALEPWTFKQGTDAVTVTAGSRVVTGVTADFLVAHSLYGPSGELELIPDNRSFFERYDPASTTTGTPEAFTVIGGSINVGPTPSATSSAYTLLYEKEFTALSADGDAPALPSGSHFALVHGGCAEGLKLQNDPTWQSFEQDFQASLTVLRQGYLANTRGSSAQFGAYRPDQWV